MLRSPVFRALAVLLCALSLGNTVSAAEVSCDGIYCFSQEDFSDNPEGICITALPDSRTGSVLLDNRAIRTGDILTLEQASRLTFTPVQALSDQTAQVEYLPIFSDHVAEPAVMTISIRGKEDKAPVAEDSAAETYKNLPITVKLKAHDPEEQSLTYAIVRQPKRGTVTIDETGSFTYTPKKNKVGIDSFVYTASDTAGNVSREATVTVTILKPSDAIQYTDTVGHDCRFTAEWMRHTGIFAGESVADQSCFRPEQVVNRGEFITMLVKAVDVPVDDYLTYTGYQDEVPKWVQPYLAAAIRAGVTAGLPYEDTFGADTPITGAEVSVLLKNALNLRTVQDAVMEEEATVPVWAVSSLRSAQEAGFSLAADSIMTRGEAANILYQASKLAVTAETLV